MKAIVAISQTKLSKNTIVNYVARMVAKPVHEISMNVFILSTESKIAVTEYDRETYINVILVYDENIIGEGFYQAYILLG